MDIYTEWRLNNKQAPMSEWNKTRAAMNNGTSSGLDTTLPKTTSGYSATNNIMRGIPDNGLGNLPTRDSASYFGDGKYFDTNTNTYMDKDMLFKDSQLGMKDLTFTEAQQTNPNLTMDQYNDGLGGTNLGSSDMSGKEAIGLGLQAYGALQKDNQFKDTLGVQKGYLENARDTQRLAQEKYDKYDNVSKGLGGAFA